MIRRTEVAPDLIGLRAPVGETLGSGFFNAVRRLGPDKVVKVARPYGPLGQPLSWLVRNRREHVQAGSYLPIPETYHVRMRTRRGTIVSVILQRRLEGERLSAVPCDRLREPVARASLARGVAQLRRCRRELGWLPDVIGGPPRRGMHDVRRSNNLFVDTAGEVWLIDPGALFFWFSRRNPIGWLYTAILLRTAERMLRRLR